MAKKRKAAQATSDLVSSSSSSTGSSGNANEEEQQAESSKNDDFVSIPPFPLKKDNRTAFEYFNNRIFFDDDDDLGYFAESRRDSPALQVPLDEFFFKARRKEQTEGQFYLLSYFTTKISLCKYSSVLATYNQWKTERSISSPPRLVSPGFQIAESKLAHNHDLDRFSDHITGLLRCYENCLQGKELVGPFFCFVQSSGMGKTKLLYEYKNTSSTRPNPVESFLILPSSSAMINVDQEKDIFDFHLDLGTGLEKLKERLPSRIEDIEQEQERRARRAAVSIFDRLDQMFRLLLKGKQKNCETIVLLFDDSQNFLEQEFEYEAFRLRCVQIWLREIREGRTVFAVFAGTDPKLTHLLLESDKDLERNNYAATSREWQPPPTYYRKKGFQIYSTFCQTTTTGSCVHLLEYISHTIGSSDYDRAVCYGRPLFALMAKKGILEKNLPQVLYRMTRCVQWESNRIAWINMLSTRVPLGETTVEVVSELVAHSFAIGNGYDDNFKDTRQLLYCLDPVCAHLAMCMMDEDYEKRIPTIATIKGMDKKWWAMKLKEIYSSGIVTPETNGSFAHVVVALYMLFCGDVLRKRINDKDKSKQAYNQFSVSLDAWLQVLLSGGKLSDAAFDDCQVSVGFIQVTRNSLRLHDDSWLSWTEQSFLKYIFESGNAFFPFQGCPLVDMVIPLRVRKGNDATCTEFGYVPMLVSIKYDNELCSEAMEKICEALKEKAETDQVGRAFCLLVVFSSDIPAESAKSSRVDQGYELKESERISDHLMEGVVLAKAVRIPLTDVFGLTAAYKAMTPTFQIDAQLFASHTFLMSHGPDEMEEDDVDLKAESALRGLSLSVETKGKYNALRRALTSVKTRFKAQRTSRKA